MKNQKNITCLVDSCQALKKREFLHLIFLADLKDPGVTSFDAAQ